MWNTYCLSMVKQMPIFGELVFQNLIKKNGVNVCLEYEYKGLTFVYIMIWNTYCLTMVKQMPIFGNLLIQNPIKKNGTNVCQNVHLSK